MADSDPICSRRPQDQRASFPEGHGYGQKTSYEAQQEARPWCSRLQVVKLSSMQQAYDSTASHCSIAEQAGAFELHTCMLKHSVGQQARQLLPSHIHVTSGDAPHTLSANRAATASEAFA